MLSGLTRTAIPKQQGEAIDSARALFETVLPQNEAVGCLISLHRETRKSASTENSKDSKARVRFTVSKWATAKLIGPLSQVLINGDYVARCQAMRLRTGASAPRCHAKSSLDPPR